MGRKNQRNEQRVRLSLIQEAARIMAEDGVKDFLVAKRKAAQRLGVRDQGSLPTNQEIQDAVIEHQRLFQADTQPRRLRALRELAVEAMGFLAPFRPRLVGSVLDGTAGPASDVNLHVFAATAEEVSIFLMEHDIPHETAERTLRFGPDDSRDMTVYRFVARDEVVDLTVFTERGPREAPRSRVDGRPLQRAALDAVRALVDEAGVSM